MFKKKVEDVPLFLCYFVWYHKYSWIVSISLGYLCEYKFSYNWSLSVHWIMLLNLNSLVSQMCYGSDPTHEYLHTQLIFLKVITSIKMGNSLVFNNEKCIGMLVPEQFAVCLFSFFGWMINLKIQTHMLFIFLERSSLFFYLQNILHMF